MNLLSQLSDRDSIKAVFDHVKDLMACSFLYAAGVLAQRQQTFLPDWLSDYSGWGMMAAAILLVLIKLADGIRRLMRSRWQWPLVALLIGAYVLVSCRVVVVTAALRTKAFTNNSSPFQTSPDRIKP